MVPSIDTAYQVRKEVAERSENILRDWTLLNWFLRHHELTIRHRWWKRNVAQRKKLLLVSWPNMPRSRRPDITADIQQSHGTSCYKEAFLWPNICLEVLVAKKLFLYYLNSRGRYRPHNFIAADRASAEYGVLTKNIEIFSLDNYEIAFVNEASSEYGKLLETKCSMNSHLRMKTGDGLLGLEIQERLYRFLVTCAASLLPDISREQYLSEIVPEVPEPPSIDLDTDSSQSGVAANYTPYRLPARFDITRLLALINAKRAATEDHIWALREDPGYFTDVLYERREHRPELLRRTDGLKRSSSPDEENQLWNRVIRSVLSDAFAALGMWDEMQRQLKRLMSLMEYDSGGLASEEPLSDGLEQAFCKMVWFLERMCIFPVANLKMGLQSSPPMRQFFGQEEGPDRIIGVVVTKKFLDDKRRKELLSIVTMLYNEPSRSHFGLPTLIDALDILIQRETYIKEMISPYMMGTISDLSVMTECLREISAFQPWAAQFEHTKAKYAEPLGRDWAATAKGWILLESDPVNLDLATLGAPTGKRFFYPADKPRTLKSTAEMQQAEANLDEFWKIVDTEIRLKDATLCSAIGRQLLGTSRLLYRTPDWVEPAKPPKQYIGQSSEHSQIEVDFELVYRTSVTPRSDRIHSNIRAKTRETSQAPPLREPATQVREPSPRSKIAVSWRALEVFNTIFPTKDKGSRPGELDWQDFQQAMAEAGFKYKSVTGSIRQFTNSKEGWSIHVHEPHPRPKLAFLKARRIGRRLNQNFGLDVTMFCHKSSEHKA